MKALSLTQPWASLVAIGAKRIETRSWATAYRGPIAIHASKGFPKWARETCETEPFSSALVLAGVRFTSPPPQHWYHVPAYRLKVDTVPLGCIVAVANLTACQTTSNIRRIAAVGGLLPHELDFGDYADNRFGWLLTDVTRLPEPIPCRGALGLWTVPPEIAAQLGRAK